MNTNALRDTLARLHQQLQSSPQLDADSRQMLQQVLADLQHVAAGQQPVEHPAGTPGQRLRSLAAGFESGHPGLAAGLRELITMLGGAGV